MKVCCYIRCSTELQNLDSQRQILESFVKLKGWDADFFEEKESTRKTRPIKASMLEKLRNREYQCCIVTKIDRYARSSRELLLEIDELIKKDISFISVNDNLDFSTPTGRLNFQILSAFAEFERSLISQRTKESLQRLKQNGVQLGRPHGSKDKKNRKKSGYFLKEAKKRKVSAESKGIFLPLENYINQSTKQSCTK
jgi:putative DNA-invertase from lambdoid prophage Rac